MYFKYILLLTLAVASNGMLNISLSSSSQGNRCEGYPWDTFRCGDGGCILAGDACNLYDDCEDGSDENNCTNHVCDSHHFRCQSGQCILKSKRCDGVTQCPEGSDEENCLECFESWDAPKIPFKCVASNKCIPADQQCNSIKDCPDGSDEDEAVCQNFQCAKNEIKCGAGHCVHRDWVCEGFDPCGEEYDTDKLNLTCRECPWDTFSCKTENKCIRNSSRCDGVPDCEDGSDESESFCLGRKCGRFGHLIFQCQNGQCLNDYQDHPVACNVIYDCKDKSDEANCTTCGPWAFQCGSRECIHKRNICNSIVDCSDGSDEKGINCPDGPTPPFLTQNWRKNPSPKFALQHLTEDLAVYFDSSVLTSVTWPFSPLSQAWKYAKETFELATLSDPGSQFLYVVLGKRNDHWDQKSFSFRALQSGHRNIIDPGLRERNGWSTVNSRNFENLFSGLGYIVKIAMEGVESNAEYKLCSNTLSNIVFYDIYIHLKGQGSADVVQYKANQFKRTFKLGQYNCFRDWFLPVYEKYGGATVLKNYFKIFKRNWPKNRGGVAKFINVSYTYLNVGEFVHFWSGAAGEDLRYLAKSAFIDWKDVFMRQFAKAQADFPNITYPLKIMSGSRRHNAHLNYMEKSSSHHLRS